MGTTTVMITAMVVRTWEGGTEGLAVALGSKAGRGEEAPSNSSGSSHRHSWVVVVEDEKKG